METFYSFILVFINEVLGDMTLEKIAALATIIAFSLGFALWAVTAIVTNVIQRELGKLVHVTTGLDKRILRVEVKLGLDKGGGDYAESNT